MRKRALLSAVLLLAAAPLFAKDKAHLQAEGRAIIERAIKVSDLRAPSVGPFVLKATRLATKESPEAKYVFYWSAPNYREEVTENGRTEVRVGNATTEWRQHRTYLSSRGFGAFNNVVDVTQSLRRISPQSVTNLQLKNENGAQLECFNAHEKSAETELCFEPTSSALVLSTERRTLQFQCPPYSRLCSNVPTVSYSSVTDRSRWAEFKGVLVAQAVRIQYSRESVREWRIDSLDALDARSGLFEPETGAESWERCEDVTAARSIPTITAAPNGPELSGVQKVKLQVIITTAGEVSEAYVISEERPGDGAKVIEHLKQRRYEPARCGDKSVQGELIINWRGDHR